MAKYHLEFYRLNEETPITLTFKTKNEVIDHLLGLATRTDIEECNWGQE
jgi:hypothetical protein|tara:strand:+ start:849 stop:995 length:147 start_codon:yes stop_codon:yes gene_type:complete